MNCQGLRRALHAYFAQALAREEERALEAHAAGCAACGELLRLAGEISCKELAEFLDDYVDGELDATRRDVFERHLALCPDCAAYLDSYRKTVALCRSTSAEPGPLAEPPPPALIAAVLAARKRVS